MQGNLHVPFLGGWVGAILPGYPADEETCIVQRALSLSNVLSAWRAPGHCRHHPGGGDHPDPAAREARGGPTFYRARPFPPRSLRLGGIRHLLPQDLLCRGQHALLPTMSCVAAWAACVRQRCALVRGGHPRACEIPFEMALPASLPPASHLEILPKTP